MCVKGLMDARLRDSVIPEISFFLFVFFLIKVGERKPVNLQLLGAFREVAGLLLIKKKKRLVGKKEDLLFPNWIQILMPLRKNDYVGKMFCVHSGQLNNKNKKGNSKFSPSTDISALSYLPN